MKPVVLRLAFAAFGVLAGLATAEAFLRVARARADAKLYSPERLAALSAPAGEVVPLGQMIRPAPEADVIYDLRPGLDRVVYAGAPVSTNRHGHRGGKYPVAKPDGVVRVLGLGDSVMFGQGVGDRVPYLRGLELALAERTPETRWQVLNTAVPGYNTAQQVALLESRGLAFEPDLVIVGFVSNDVGLPGFLGARSDPWTLSRSYLAEWWRERDAAGPPASTDTPGGLAPAPTESGRAFRIEDDPTKVPERWRHLVGWDAVERALDRLAALSVKHGFEVLLFCHRES